MDKDQALIALSALSQETRLIAFKTLLEYGRTGAPAGILSEQLGVPHNTLSFHLSHLNNAGLVFFRKEGRSVIYVANCDATDALVGFLVANCCVREKPLSGKLRRVSPRKTATKRRRGS